MGNLYVWQDCDNNVQGCQQLDIKKFPDFSLTFPWPSHIFQVKI